MKIVKVSGGAILTDSFYSLVAKEVLGYDNFSLGFAGIKSKRLFIDDCEIDVWVVVIAPRYGDIRIINFAAVRYYPEKHLIQRLCVSTTRLEKEVNRQRHEKEVSRN